MPLGPHQRNTSGRFNREHGNSKVKNLAAEYPVLKKFPGEMTLGDLERKFKVDSLDQVLKATRRGRRT